MEVRKHEYSDVGDIGDIDLHINIIFLDLLLHQFEIILVKGNDGLSVIDPQCIRYVSPIHGICNYKYLEDVPGCC